MEPETVCEEISDKDLRPEYCQYRDEGCKVSGSCLQCPLTQCIFDKPRGQHRMLKTVRDRQMIALFHQGKSTTELAKRFGVTRRTIQRVLKNSKSEYGITKQIQISKNETTPKPAAVVEVPQRRGPDNGEIHDRI